MSERIHARIDARISARILAVAAFVSLSAVSGTSAPLAAQTATAYRVPITGTIELGLAPFVERSIREAAAAGAQVIILDVNTPGGRIDAAERIADAVRASEVPVHAFVNPRAFSAGALISLAAEKIWMTPAGVMGAVTPVDGAGVKGSEKVVSAMRAEMRALAEARGLDPSIAEAMVDESIAIPGVIEAGKLLTMTTEDAVRNGYATEIADFDALLGELDVGAAEVVTASVNWAERMVRFLSNPIVSPFLLSLGFLGLLVEIKSPGLGMAGAAGVVSLLLFFGSNALVGLAGWEEMLFFGVGAGLLMIEILVIPGFGIFGIVGVVGMALGIFLSLLGDITYLTADDLTRAAMVVTTSFMLVAVSTWAILRHFMRSGGFARSGIVLAEPTTREAGWESATRRTDLEGKEGVAITDLRPSGVALVGEERLDVVTESEWVEEGTRVRVVRAEGYRHVVRPLTDA